MGKKRDIEGNRLHHFELSDKNRTVRWVLVAILLVVAVVAVIVGLMSALQTPAGWQTVQVNTGYLDCSEEFVLQYEYGAGDTSATAESKALTRLYGEVTQDAWKLFYNEAGETDLSGLYKLNKNPDQEIVVHKGLYAALEQVVKSGNRALYLAPVYAEYNQLFYSENAVIAQQYDPGQNEEQRAYVQTLADYARDPEAVNLVLKDGKVTLQVSDAYMAFAKEHEIRFFLDFGWLRNAFIADYIASALTENGFTNGYIASLDGFTRNLDQRKTSYSLNLFDKGEDGVTLAAVMNYNAPQSLVFLRSYPMYDKDAERYYGFADGRMVTAMIDPADGQSKTAADTLVSYSAELSCGELALSVMPVYVADSFSEDAVNGLTERGIYSVWFNGKQVMHNQKDLQITVKHSDYTK